MTTYINNFEIKNFKSIRLAKLDSCRRINVFIGYPNVGKSNILEALSLFALQGDNNIVTDLIRIENLVTLFFNGNINRQFLVNVNGYSRIQGKLENNRISVINEFDREKIGFDLIDKSARSIDKKHAFTMCSFYIDNENRIRQFNGINQIKANHSEDDIITISKYDYKKGVQFKSTNTTTLDAPIGSNLFEIIYRNKKLKDDIVELFKQYNLHFSFDNSSREFKILRFINDEIFIVPFSMVADTLQRLIFYKAAIKSNIKEVLLFEEPESHMFAPFISRFTSDIIDDENENQFFLTTHSPFVLSDLMENLKDDELAIYLVDYKSDTGETVVNRMNKNELHEASQFGYDFFLNLKNFMPNK